LTKTGPNAHKNVRRLLLVHTVHKSTNVKGTQPQGKEPRQPLQSETAHFDAVHSLDPIKSDDT